MNFQEFLSELLQKKHGDVFLVKGNQVKLRGMAKFTSKNLYPDEYFKLSFEGGEAMVVIPSEEQIMFGKGLGALREVGDEEIGTKEIIEFEGEAFTLDNIDDYQYCLEMLAGRPGLDIEGECKFSDYVGKENDSNLLSLGFLSDSGERADVFMETIEVDAVEFF